MGTEQKVLKVFLNVLKSYNRIQAVQIKKDRKRTTTTVCPEQNPALIETKGD